MDCRRQVAQQRFGFRERRFGAATDEVEPPLPGFRLTAKYRSIEVSASPRRHSLREPHRDGRIRRRGVDHQDIGAQMLEQRFVEHCALRVRSSDADEDDGLSGDRGRYGFGLGDTPQLRRRSASSPVPRSHLVSGANKVAHHASTHRAEADEGDVAHS